MKCRLDIDKADLTVESEVVVRYLMEEYPDVKVNDVSDFNVSGVSVNDSKVSDALFKTGPALVP